jgi:hypothetical protein
MATAACLSDVMEGGLSVRLLTMSIQPQENLEFSNQSQYTKQAIYDSKRPDDKDEASWLHGLFDLSGSQ